MEGVNNIPHGKEAGGGGSHTNERPCPWAWYCFGKDSPTIPVKRLIKSETVGWDSWRLQGYVQTGYTRAFTYVQYRPRFVRNSLGQSEPIWLAKPPISEDVCLIDFYQKALSTNNQVHYVDEFIEMSNLKLGEYIVN